MVGISAITAAVASSIRASRDAATKVDSIRSKFASVKSTVR